MTVIVGNFFNLFLKSWVAACVFLSGSHLSTIPTEKENIFDFFFLFAKSGCLLTRREHGSAAGPAAEKRPDGLRHL